MHENAARALQYYEELPRRSGRPDLRLVDSEPRTRRRLEAEHAHEVDDARDTDDFRDADALIDRDAIAAGASVPDGPEVHVITLDAPPAERPRRAEPRRRAEDRPRPALARPAFPARRRETVAPRIAGRPDRVAMWAVLLGFFLTAVAAATGHG